MSNPQTDRADHPRGGAQKLPCEECGKPTVTRVNGEPYCSGSCLNPDRYHGIWQLLFSSIRNRNGEGVFVWLALTPLWAIYGVLWTIFKLVDKLINLARATDDG